MRRTALNRNHYFMFGILLGLVFSLYIPQDIWKMVQQEECPQQLAEQELIDKFGQDFQPYLNLINKPLSARKPIKNVIRPRYYSSELGIREKLFVGVMTTQSRINTFATALNRTTAHLVNKMKFFINADSVRANHKLRNVVGFTDTREQLRPFHVLKYIADNYLNDYDYFLVMPDHVYVDARKLVATLQHISVTFDIYMGMQMMDVTAKGDPHGSMDGDAHSNDRSFCDLNAGILLSSSVIRKMRTNLDWCVRNGATSVHSVNIGRCVKYSSNLSACQRSFQDVQFLGFVLDASTSLAGDLRALAKNDDFLNASTVFAVTSADDFYRLHALFSQHHLGLVRRRSDELEYKSYRIANGTLSNRILEIRWPLGVPKSSAPETRHDLITWQLLNRTHLYLPNTENVVEPLTRIESLDLERILQITLDYAQRKHPHLKYEGLHTVYRRFDPTRGMDYQLHARFHDRQHPGAALVVKSFHVVKPLGRMEMIPSPYVTESTRVAILVPVFEHQADNGIDFVEQYEQVCMKSQDNTFLLLIFLYRYATASKGDADPFKTLKALAVNLSTKYKNDGSRIAWVSIRLPSTMSEAVTSDDVMWTSSYGRNEVLSIAVADLALPKVGLDSLILMASTSVHFRPDFLNRVRMNTIKGYQIFAPVGFMMYPCKFTHFCKECDTCDVSQSTGYFDKWNHDVISFYTRDYVQARKLVEDTLAIIRNDADIEGLFGDDSPPPICTIIEMFVRSQWPVHILRGVEPNLRYGDNVKRYLEANGTVLRCSGRDQRRPNDSSTNDNGSDLPAGAGAPYADVPIASHKCVRLASRKQIGDAIIHIEDKSLAT